MLGSVRIAKGPDHGIDVRKWVGGFLEADGDMTIWQRDHELKEIAVPHHDELRPATIDVAPLADQ